MKVTHPLVGKTLWFSQPEVVFLSNAPKLKKKKKKKKKRKRKIEEQHRECSSI